MVVQTLVRPTYHAHVKDVNDDKQQHDNAANTHIGADKGSAPCALLLGCLDFIVRTPRCSIDTGQIKNEGNMRQKAEYQPRLD